MKLTVLALGALAVQSFTFEPQASSASQFAYRKITNTAFKEGETLKFRVHYGLINAGKITMSIGASTQTIKGRKAYYAKIDGETLQSFDFMYKVRDKFESWIDAESMAPLRYAKTVRENKYFDEDLAIYMHDKKKMRNKKGELSINSYTQDIASAIFYARNLDYTHAKVNQTFPLDVYLDNKVYKLQFTYLGTETISTDLGKVKCIKLRPKLVVDRVFKGDNDMTIWISNDKNKIPIRIESAIRVGSVKVDITGYSNLKNTFDALVK